MFGALPYTIVTFISGVSCSVTGGQEKTSRSPISVTAHFEVGTPPPQKILSVSSSTVHTRAKTTSPQNMENHVSAHSERAFNSTAEGKLQVHEWTRVRGFAIKGNRASEKTSGEQGRPRLERLTKEPGPPSHPIGTGVLSTNRNDSSLKQTPHTSRNKDNRRMQGRQTLETRVNQGLEIPREPHISRNSRDFWLRANENFREEKQIWKYWAGVISEHVRKF